MRSQTARCISAQRNNLMNSQGIIDIHTHQPTPYPGKTITDAESARAILEQMDSFGVAISGLLGHVIAGQTADEMRASIRQTRDVVKQAPDRLFGMVFVNPAVPADILAEELDRNLQTPQFRGIKLELDVNSRDKRLDLVMEKAIQYGVPVLYHSWYLNTWSMSQAERDYQGNRSEPHDVADLARRFPEARVIMAHLEGSGLRGILDVADVPNVWIDTSGSQPFTGTLEFAVETLGSKRILFGSDLMGRSLESQLGRIFGANLAEDDLENILRANARELFRITGDRLT